ncbi:hypothetical protein Taro_047908 [Colocasia esculenta]|uniref:Uncharacterized protein n=1 Tax=Colocasia esculenta TaxID=4460 RepID=A0A843WWP8_COLES|nr:hypothetical protein [Colocasia esculenta]
MTRTAEMGFGQQVLAVAAVDEKRTAMTNIYETQSDGSRSTSAGMMLTYVQYRAYCILFALLCFDPHL